MRDWQICGIQQVGIGNKSVYDTWEWYRSNLGLNVPVFDEAAEAALMLPYTGGKPRSRHAVLALNMQGGGGAEIWQYTSRNPKKADFKVKLGDLGIVFAKYKSTDISKSWSELSKEGILSSSTDKDPQETNHFFLEDPDGNLIQMIESDDWFNKGSYHSGGIYGVGIGVSDMDKSIKFYSELLGYDHVIYDQTGVFNDLKNLSGGKTEYRRVCLTHSTKREGAFSTLFGASQIELFESKEYKGRPIFENRLWGDLGYIHLCFDIINMDALRKDCSDFGCAFQVDSGDFDMGEAAGKFAYIEDPDGTLIEFVETLKVPILKKIGWYLDLRKRDQKRNLPRWMIKALGLNKKTKPVNL